MQRPCRPARQDQWPSTARRFAEIFASRTRDEWSEVFDGTDACVAPVLALGEVAEHPHTGRAAARRRRQRQPRAGAGAAPLQDARCGDPAGARAGQHTDEVFRECGFTDQEIRTLREGAIIG